MNVEVQRVVTTPDDAVPPGWRGLGGTVTGIDRATGRDLSLLHVVILDPDAIAEPLRTTCRVPDPGDKLQVSIRGRVVAIVDFK